jgi:IS1 family transposase
VRRSIRRSPSPQGKTIVLELDARWHSLQKNHQQLWRWPALDQETGPLLDWNCGRRDNATVQQMGELLAQGDVKGYGTAPWAP